MPFEIEATTLDNRLVAEKTFGIWLYAPQIAHTAIPGQFVMVSAGEKFLRRPFSIASVSGGRIFLLIRVIGEGSAIISSLRRNENAKILGPFGNGFPDDIDSPILVGGGIGIAPMIFAAQHLKNIGANFKIIYGEQSSKKIIADELLPDRIEISTDDGGFGLCGTAVDLLLKNNPAPIFACGPEPMLKKIAKIAAQWNVPAFFSLEARMACGFGVCQGCVIKTKVGYKRVCADGPVFQAENIW